MIASDFYQILCFVLINLYHDIHGLSGLITLVQTTRHKLFKYSNTCQYRSISV